MGIFEFPSSYFWGRFLCADDKMLKKPTAFPSFDFRMEIVHAFAFICLLIYLRLAVSSRNKDRINEWILAANPISQKTEFDK